SLGPVFVLPWTAMDIRFGDWVLDRGRRELLRGGEGVPVTSKALQLLELLLEKRPDAVAKAGVYDRPQPSTFVAEVNLSRRAVELRGPLGDDTRRPRWMRTVRGFGYAFAGAAIDGGRRTPQRTPVEVGECRLILRDREVALAEGENVLGRSHRAAVWLEARGVSRRHARILVSGARAILEDLGSKNGTFWRGARISAQ